MSLPWLPEDLPAPAPPPGKGHIAVSPARLPRDSFAYTRHPNDVLPIMTCGQRFASFKLAFPDVAISADKRSATWVDDSGMHRKSFDTPISLIRYLESAFSEAAS